MGYTEKFVFVKNLTVGDSINMNAVKGSLYTLDKKKFDPKTSTWTLSLSSGLFTGKRVLSGNTRLLVRK